jgi:hypothetical protein
LYCEIDVPGVLYLHVEGGVLRQRYLVNKEGSKPAAVDEELV